MMVNGINNLYYYATITAIHLQSFGITQTETLRP